MYKVIIPQDITEKGKQFLRDKGYEVIVGPGVEDVEVYKEIVKDADALLVRTGPYPKAVIDAAPKLKVIGRFGVGTDNIDVDYCTQKGIYVTFTPTANALSVAEHTLGLLIMCAHQMKALDKAVQEGNWHLRNKVPTYNIGGKTLGLVGLGRIGAHVAKMARLGLNMNVIAYDSMRPKNDVPEGIKMCDNMDEVFENSDFVSLHIPCTEDTKGIINQDMLRKMKPTAFLINTGRGGLIVEQDLVNAIKGKIISGAAMDVLIDEPPKPDNPLLKLDNVIITPHSATLTLETMDLVGLHAAMGIHSVLSGQKPDWPVNKI
ncbi:hydroxyacid dehydrogenase [Fusibacter ferrireducens]|uniref:Hydroxyacid dehydrogenase n=1 Tax=Fusibacter ferrireducens TaxID=2785058 RepID=A0ABR9ZZK7_9FIRM|nr:hydroxyacid dehydrogenase [Fusibacter ferrireducens]MBF4695059.1 hydroxyacid dehydrogenase [Fusibacter ferrireducens]